MSFNKKARQEAAAQQAQMFAQQQAIFAAQQAKEKAYNDSFDKRNAGIIQLRGEALNWHNRYEKGTDVADLLPADMKIHQQAADTVRNTMTMARGMGDSSQLPRDADYQAKLSHVASARLGTGLAAIASDRLSNRDAETRQTISQSESYLNTDRQAGFQMGGQIFQMADNLWQNATTRRQMEVQIAQQAMGNLMNWVSVGVGAVSGLAGAFKPKPKTT